MLKRPLRCSLRVQGCHHPSYVPSGGETSSFLQERGETCLRVYQEDVLQGAVKQLYMAFFSGHEWVFQQDWVPAQNPRQLRCGCRGTFRPLSVPRIGTRGVQTSTPRTTNCGLFGGHGLPKASQQPGQSEEIPRESSGRDPLGDGTCRNGRVAGASQGLRQGRGGPF